MSREIKFRIWYRTKKEMSLPDWLDENGNVYRDEGYAAPNYMKKETYELMQYTGIKDKNRVEIYEGDIVKRLDTTIGKVTWECDYKALGFHLNSDGKLMDVINPYSSWSLEVIGNIYENPDLMKR